jgi:RNA polymerase sigma-19 factor, ECF subfamily
MFANGHSYMNNDDFKRLFDNYKNRLFGYVLAISHSEYIAEEITQEIFIKLWICHDMLNQVENIDGYIFTIARNKTLNHLRKAAHDIKLLSELQGRMVSENNNVEEYTLTAEYDKLVHEALTLLSPQRRLVYKLSRNNGLNHQEIASQLQLSRSTVKNHLVEALRFIRKYLGKYNSTFLLMVFFSFINLFR